MSLCEEVTSCDKPSGCMEVAQMFAVRAVTGVEGPRQKGRGGAVTKENNPTQQGESSLLDSC